MRVSHPLLPISVEVPRETEVWIAPAFRLGRLRAKDGRREDLLLFGLRALGEGARRRHALEVGFLWVTPQARGVDAERLDRLLRGMENPGTAEEFLRDVLYAELPHIRLDDEGLIKVSGRPARRIGVSWRALIGTRHERQVRGEAILIPVHPAAAIVVLGRFDEASNEEERQVVFPRIAASIRLEHALEL
jgi:hypothetical protein